MSIFTTSLILIVAGLGGLLRYFWLHAKQDRAYLAEQKRKTTAR